MKKCNLAKELAKEAKARTALLHAQIKQVKAQTASTKKATRLMKGVR